MHPFTPPPPDPSTQVTGPDVEGQADVDQAPAPGPRRGELVTVTYFDTATLEDVVRVGLVVDVVAEGVRVAYLPEISDPIPLVVDPEAADDVATVRVAPLGG